ncbi:MAG: SdpI family protein [Lachnospiraceae bacterium]|nr:SdpI family protein [Ruminococcus sp.]MCM1276178.1 SdpI family protein [Lachnospiraceae bacterium]
MGESVIIAVCDMFLPLTLLGLGLMVWLTKPDYGNVFGYRTTWSLKSGETWERAQGVFGKMCTMTYAALSFLTLVSGLLPIIIGGFDEYVTEILVTAVNLTNVLALFAVIGATEGIVKREFDKDGNPKAGGANE